MADLEFPRHAGGRELKKYLGGGTIAKWEAIKAKCYDCMGRYDDGAIDCKILECPLYPYMPYNKSDGAITTN